MGKESIDFMPKIKIFHSTYLFFYVSISVSAKAAKQDLVQDNMAVSKVFDRTRLVVLQDEGLRRRVFDPNVQLEICTQQGDPVVRILNGSFYKRSEANFSQIATSYEELLCTVM